VKRQHGFVAGNARIVVLPAASGAELGASDPETSPPARTS
jgi:hypothetical protein